VLEVAGTGAGIRVVDLPHVFERFWRAEKSGTRRGCGSGLGLGTARRLALAHHGNFSAVSTPG
jgi:two-component system, OmpR family, sensor histidine kinase BaeS